MDWQHPTHRKPQTVALVSLGPSRESYVAQALARDPDPLIVDCDEIWTVNRGALPVRHNLVWVMDNIQGEADAYRAEYRQALSDAMNQNPRYTPPAGAVVNRGYAVRFGRSFE